MKIYIEDIAAYNNGKLHGVWIDLDEYTDIAEVQEEIDKMLADSPEEDAEEWQISDFEGPRFLSDISDIENLLAINEAMRQYGEDEIASYIGMVGLHYVDAGRLSDDFEEAFAGTWKSEEEFAQDLFEQIYEIPDFLEYYIDWEKVARDLFINDYYSIEAEEGGVHVFRGV